MFEQARVKLAVYYTIIILAATGVLSFLFYQRTVSVITSEYERIGRRFMVDQESLVPRLHDRVMQRILPEDVVTAKRRIVVQLVWINVMVAGIAAGLSYVLAGWSLKPLQAAHEEQKRFVADAAHELKTPLTALRTSLEVNLMDKKLPQKTRKILQENLEDVTGLWNLTESLLKLARVNGVRLRLKPVLIGGVLERAVKQMKPVAKKEGVMIEMGKIPKNLEVIGDEDVLVELMVIFLDNAIKYSSRETWVKVRVVVEKKQAVVAIVDRGVGIAKHHLPYIFDRFYRVDSARSKSDAVGYGLGLAVAKKIVDEHGGKVTVVSKVGEGTEVKVWLPMV